MIAWVAGLALSLSLAQQPQPPGPDRLRDLTAAWETPCRTALGPHHNLYNPCVVRTSDRAYPYRMWFFGWATGDNNPVDGRPIGDAIYFARGASLDRWEVYAGDRPDGLPMWVASNQPERYRPVVSGLDPGFGGAIAGDPSVVIADGKYHMAFSSVWFESHPETTPQHMYLIPCVMGARSTDGIHWTRTHAPIAIWEKEYVIRQDAAGGVFTRPADYCGSYHRPALLRDGGRWRLWFDYYKPGTFTSMGLAECRGDFMDPKAWRIVHAGDGPVLSDWVNPCVVKAARRYYSLSDAAGYPATLGGDGRLLTMAESDDGLRWRILGHIRPEGMASSHVPEAFVERDRSGLWLVVFYSWKPAGEAGKPWDYRYKEIRWMRRRLEPDGRLLAPRSTGGVH